MSNIDISELTRDRWGYLRYDPPLREILHSDVKVEYTTTWHGGPLDGWQVPKDPKPAQIAYWWNRVSDAFDDLGYDVAMRGLVRAVLQPHATMIEDVNYDILCAARLKVPHERISQVLGVPVHAIPHRIRDTLRRVAHEQYLALGND